jgi:predicted GNAT family N-acyltransferase
MDVSHQLPRAGGVDERQPDGWRPGVRVKVAESPAEWAGAVAVRLAVFVAEQRVPLALELDEHDRSAVHAVAVLDPQSELEYAQWLAPARSGVAARAGAQAGKYLPVSLSGTRGGLKDLGTAAPAVGTGRLLQAAGGVARIGRLAVLPAWRGRGLGSRMLRLLEEAALARGAQRVVVHAQVPARAFYARRGYSAEPGARVFLEDSLPHLRLSKPLSLDM